MANVFGFGMEGRGVQDVKLLDIQGTPLFVKGLDVISGTPVLDIKLKI